MIFRAWFWSAAVALWLLLPILIAELSDSRTIAHIFLMVTDR